MSSRVIRPTCNLRYENYCFSDATVDAALPLPRPPSTNNTASEAPPPSTNNTVSEGNSNTSRIVIATVVPIIVATIFLLVIIMSIYSRVRKSNKNFEAEGDVDDEIRNIESLQFHFDTIRVATNNFSDANKLGKGGFGVVYKGRLTNGQEIAVKRLSMDSGQGNTEFKNEVLLLAMLQHRNLVRLLGFCLEGHERLLIYEFVQNKSHICGYMASEYAIFGQFSMKYDVFNFGIVVREIASGHKNSGICHGEYTEHFISFTWKYWREGTDANIIDPTLNNGSRNEMLRCIHIGLLCVQETLAYRPPMATVVHMLDNCSLTLPVPSKPAFFVDNRSLSSMPSWEFNSTTTKSSEQKNRSTQESVNKASITGLYPY